MSINLVDALAVQKTPEQLKARARRGEIIYLGYETRTGWSGSLPFYLFQCPDCKTLGKDYPHNQGSDRRLDCPECGKRLPFPESPSLKEIFQLLGWLIRRLISPMTT